MADIVSSPEWELIVGDWWVLSLRCSDCGKVAARFIAPHAATDELAIVATGAWVRVGSEDETASERVRDPCRCDWSAYPSADACRGQIRRAIRRGLGERVEFKAITVRSKPESA